MSSMGTDEKKAAAEAKAHRPAYDLTMWAVTLVDPSGRYGTHKLFMAYGDTAEEAEQVAMKSRPGSTVNREHPTVYQAGVHPATRNRSNVPPEGWGKPDPETGEYSKRIFPTVHALMAELSKLPPNTQVTHADAPADSTDALELFYSPTRQDLTL